MHALFLGTTTNGLVLGWNGNWRGSVQRVSALGVKEAIGTGAQGAGTLTYLPIMLPGHELVR